VSVSAMIERIRELEAISRRLEPERDARAHVRDAVMAYGDDFLERLPRLKTYEISKEKAKDLRNSPICEEPAEIDELLTLFEDYVVEPGLNPASGGHIAYIPGGGIYPEGSGGNLASGGSIANLIGIVTARDAHGLQARDFYRAVVYLSGQAHHCIHKALRITGLGECVLHYIAMDERYRMIPAALEDAIAEDRAAGLIPWLVIAAAGTTDVGAIDPLEAIGGIAKANGLWYHVDAAYGGFFALVDECRPRLRGMELSDSIVLDPHKGLFLPYGTGAVLVKDKRAMQRAHHYQASYMQDILAEEALESGSPAELSPELSRHFRGLRLWLPLKLHGVAPFRACLEEKLLLTRYFYEEVQRLGFEVGPVPELSVATYRYLPDSGDANAFNQALLDEIHRDGRVFVSSTMLDGKFVLRLAVLAFRTHLETVDVTLEMLEQKAGALARTWNS
jgi:aromatic-L-amino-acid decarboxylase